MMKFDNHKHIARFTIEATTPLAIGSGVENAITDQLVMRDANGMPYIPGTSLAGALRSALQGYHFDGADSNTLFGDEACQQGSLLIISNACLLGTNGNVVEGINQIDDEFLNHYKVLPIRQHVRITHKGVGANQAKFDQEVVYKGTRFVFELAMHGGQPSVWMRLVESIVSQFPIIGGGSHNGFGHFEVVACSTRSFDMKSSGDRVDYLAHSASLNSVFKGETVLTEATAGKSSFIKYSLSLKPENFFLFGAGGGDETADMIPVKEEVVEWSDPNHPKFSEQRTLIPGTSVKGALAHRVAYHYNKLMNLTTAKVKELAQAPDKSWFDSYTKGIYKVKLDGKTVQRQTITELATQYNPAMINLFGYTAEDANSETLKLLEWPGSNHTETDEALSTMKGKVVIKDVFLNVANEKYLNHVAIDRFTGGALDGALFTERVSYNPHEFTLEIWVDGQGGNLLPEAEKALQLTLDDLCNGRLPLGGGVMRGNGCFTGSYKKIKRNENRFNAKELSGSPSVF